MNKTIRKGKYYIFLLYIMNNLIPNDSDINRALDYLLSLESVYVLCLIILNILNLCVFYGNKNLLFIMSNF